MSRTSMLRLALILLVGASLPGCFNNVRWTHPCVVARTWAGEVTNAPVPPDANSPTNIFTEVSFHEVTVKLEQNARFDMVVGAGNCAFAEGNGGFPFMDETVTGTWTRVFGGFVVIMRMDEDTIRRIEARVEAFLEANAMPFAPGCVRDATVSLDLHQLSMGFVDLGNVKGEILTELFGKLHFRGALTFCNTETEDVPIEVETTFGGDGSAIITVLEESDALGAP